MPQVGRTQDETCWYSIRRWFHLDKLWLGFLSFSGIIARDKNLPRICDGNLSFAGQAPSFRRTIRR
jgi:hypothetical protein